MNNYQHLKQALGSKSLPLAFLDLDAFDTNIQHIISRAKNVPIRIATKSIRCRWAIQYVLDKLGPQASGLMCFYPDEACFLAENGFDNLLIAYPYLNQKHVSEILKWISMGKTIYWMVDSSEQIESLAKHVPEQSSLNLCLDIDMGLKLPLLFFGVYRSSFKSVEKWKEIDECLKKHKKLKLKAVMGYEAQIAGLGDNNPFQKMLNFPIQLLKKLSVKTIHKRRAKLVELIRKSGYELDFVNGGGTGSIETTIKDSSVSEVAVGSGFYSPALFDYYKNFRHQAAAGFALEATRRPQKNMVTCAGGGYVASGSASADKLPVPYLPNGLQLIKDEGTGEVQTPLKIQGHIDIALGDPIIFRHAKAGELCERFNILHLIRANKIIESVPTYRGEMKCFL